MRLSDIVRNTVSDLHSEKSLFEIWNGVAEEIEIIAGKMWEIGI